MRCNQKRLQQRALTNKNGYTLIIAVIIMAVLLTIGVAVLTSAANGLNTVNRRVEDRQAYYVAKSAINVVDESMHGGALGDYVRDKAYSKAMEKVGAVFKGQVLTAKSVTLQGEDLDGCKIENLKIVYTAKVEDMSGTIKQYQLDLSNVTVTFAAKSGEKTYNIKASYTYNGMASPQTSGTANWGNETWVTESVSQ